MNHLGYVRGELCVENIPCNELASRYGTPLYVYSRAAIEEAWRAFDQALAARPHLICYAMKANSNLGVLSLLAKLGSGFDIVSGGELARVRAAGGDLSKVVFSGVGKSRDEMAQALGAQIKCFNVESLQEIDVLAEVAAAHGVVAPVSVRINPDVDAGTHPYISTGLKENKFGVDANAAIDAYRKISASAHLDVVGIDFHIGSQLTDIAPYKDALQKLLELCDSLKAQGIDLKHLDLGGGQGIRYRDEQPIDLNDWATAMDDVLGSRDVEIIVEPGRSIVGNAGVLLSRVRYLKHTQARNFAVVDAAMNDLIRPSLYTAWQDIVPVVQNSDASASSYDVVGPICESGDFLGKDRDLSLQNDDLLAVLSSGAYCFAMSSNYNSRPRAAEVIVDGKDSHVVRERESIESLYSGESVLPS